MTISAYLGEFLLVPYALELSLIEPCDYACRYCFAILGDRARTKYKTDTGKSNRLQSTLNLLSDLHNRETLEAQLFNYKYPTLISNRTDPFGRKNRQPTIALLEIFQELGNPVAFQTKGFIEHEKDFERVMDLIKPSHWYISISFENDEDRKRVEPGAPPISYRWELAKELKRRGHVVSIGLNPYVPHWIEQDSFVLRLQEAEVDAIAIQPLHLQSSNFNAMTEREKDDLCNGDRDWLKKVAKKKDIPEDWVNPIRDMMLKCRQAKIPIIGNDCGWAHDVWGSTHALYERTLPTIADFAWHCKQNLKYGDPVTFQYFYEWFLSWDVPDIYGSLSHAIRIKSWTVCERIKELEGWDKWHTNMDYFTLLRIAWQWMDRVPSLTPYAMPCFCPMLDNDKKIVCCDQGLPVLAYCEVESHPLDYIGSYSGEFVQAPPVYRTGGACLV